MTTTVGSHDYRLLKLVDFIGESFVWGSKQYISLWRAVEDDCIEITFLCASSPVGAHAARAAAGPGHQRAQVCPDFIFPLTIAYFMLSCLD